MGLWKARQWRAVKRLPGDAHAWFALGVAASQAGRTDEAVYALVHAVELAPEDAEQALAAAQQLTAAGRYAEAEEIYRRTMSLAGNHSELRAGLVRLLLDRGLDVAAREEVERALGEDAADLELRSLAAEACERQGEVHAAIVHLEALLAELPEHPELNRRLASLLARTGDRGAAITCLRRVAAQVDEDDVEIATQLGIALSGEGQHEEAIEILTGVTERCPELSSAHVNRGLALLAAGALDDAVSACLRALELDERSAQAYCGLGLAYQRLERLSEAAHAFTATEQLAPDNPAGPLNLAVVLVALGEREEARQALLRAAALAPEDREIHDALQRFLAGAAAAGDDVPQAAPLDASIRGELRSFALFDVLEFLRVQKKTGSLVISSRNGAGLVRLVEGSLTSASAPGTPRLGDVLLEGNLISSAELAAALGKQRGLPEDSAEALGSILLRDKLIERAQLVRLVFDQALMALGEITSWGEGAFSFHPGDAGEAPPVSFSVQQVVLELMRRRDEREHWVSGSRN
jgi:Flp pilus assembly protein TadD